MRELGSAYKESFPLFVSGLSTQIYVNVNKLVIGSFLGMSEVSIYDMADKVLHLMKLPISMMAQTVFPKISRERNIRFVNRIMLLVVGTVLLAYVCMFSVATGSCIFSLGNIWRKPLPSCGCWVYLLSWSLSIFYGRKPTGSFRIFIGLYEGDGRKLPVFLVRHRAVVACG